MMLWLKKQKRSKLFHVRICYGVTVWNRFARFRDIREHVISFSAVVAACLALSFEHLVLSNQLDTKEQVLPCGTLLLCYDPCGYYLRIIMNRL